MDDRIRTSDADRDRVIARLREHFAAGRLTADELDERVTAALNAKTFGDLRRVMADLPEPAPAPPRAKQPPPRAVPPRSLRRRVPGILPLAALALLAALVMPARGGWLFFAVIKTVVVLWLVSCLTGMFLAGRMRRRMRRDWLPGDTRYQRRDAPGGYRGSGRGCSRW